jgi:transposase
MRLRRKRGEHNQAIGRSRGGRTTKIHALSDPLCRPVVLHLTPGQNADITVAPDVLALAPPMSALLADNGYDGDDFRGEIVRRGAKPVIPNKSNRVVIHRFNKRAYQGRNVIERCFCRLKDFRRIATRYDKLARNFFRCSSRRSRRILAQLSLDPRHFGRLFLILPPNFKHTARAGDGREFCRRISRLWCPGAESNCLLSD